MRQHLSQSNSIGGLCWTHLHLLPSQLLRLTGSVFATFLSCFCHVFVTSVTPKMVPLRLLVLYKKINLIGMISMAFPIILWDTGANVGEVPWDKGNTFPSPSGAHLWSPFSVLVHL